MWERDESTENPKPERRGKGEGERERERRGKGDGSTPWGNNSRVLERQFRMEYASCANTGIFEGCTFR